MPTNQKNHKKPKLKQKKSIKVSKTQTISNSYTKKPSKPNKPQGMLKKLTKQWYDKLAVDGFQDIEKLSDGFGTFEYTGLLNNRNNPNYSGFKKDNFDHYSACRNYLTHSDNLSPRDRFIFELYSEGIVYRTILKRVKQKADSDRRCHTWYYSKTDRRGKSISLFTLSELINRILTDCQRWNETHPEGIYNQPEYVDGELLTYIK